MTQKELKWEKVEEATGYILRTKRLSDGEVTDKDVGDEDSHTLTFNETEELEWSVLPYDAKRVGTKAEKRIIKIVRETPLPMVELVSPESGVIVELEEEIPEAILLPAILKSPPDGYTLTVGFPTIFNLYWHIDADSKEHLGCYVSVKKNGTLIIDKEDIPIGQTIENHYACDVDFSTSDYEWQVIPYDAEGEAENCPWWNFSTLAEGEQTKEPDTTIGGVYTEQPTFDLPVTVKSFNKINKFNLSIAYNTTGAQVGELTDITLNPLLIGEFVYEEPYFQYGKKVIVSWSGEENIALPDDDVLFTLHFDNISGNNGGFSQVAWDKDECEWFSNDILIDYIVGGKYTNGWINTTIEEGKVPLPLNPVNMTPHQSGGTVYRFTEGEKDILINWMHGNPPRPEGWKISVKEDGVLIHDKVDIPAGDFPGETSEFPMTVTLDHTYEFQIIPYNEYGECADNVWYQFATETLIIVDAPIATVGTVETNESSTIVPITVENFNNVTGCEMELTYDPAIVTCTHATTDLPYMYFIGGPKEAGKISIAWIYFQAGDFDGISREDGTVAFELHFNKINGVTGTSPIEFDISNPLNNFWMAGKANEEFNDIPEEDFYFGGSITQEYIEITEVPESVDIVTPLDGATDVGSILNGQLMANFKWLPSTTASGYKLYMNGTEFDVGNVVSKRLELAYNTIYSWKVVPYNSVGDAIDCPVHTFTTVEDSAGLWSTSMNTPTLQADETWNLDVTVNDFFSVGAISLALNYDEEIVEVNNITSNFNLSTNDLGGQLRAAWFAGQPNDTLTLPPDHVLFTVNFNLLETTAVETMFEWSKINGECEYAGYGGTPVYSEATFSDLLWSLP